MAILSEEDRKRIKQKRLAGEFKPKPIPTPVPPPDVSPGEALGGLGDIAGTLWRGYERAGRLAGLGLGTVGAVPMSLLNYAPLRS